MLTHRLEHLYVIDPMLKWKSHYRHHCRECNRSVKNEEAFAVHKKIHRHQREKLDLLGHIPECIKKIGDAERSVLATVEDENCCCPYCLQEFPTFLDLKAHCLSYHYNSTSSMRCDICPMTYTKQVAKTLSHANMGFSKKKWEKLLVHRISHLYRIEKRVGEYQHQCPVCLGAVNNYNTFLLHKTLHETIFRTPEEEPVTRGEKREWSEQSCDVCEGYFKSQFEREQHMKSELHLDRVANPPECSVCHEKLENKWEAQRHRAVHKCYVPDPLHCRFCFKLFSREEDFKAHNAACTKRPRFVCSKCSAGFQEEYPYQIHLQKHNLKKGEVYVSITSTKHVSFFLYLISYDQK